VQSVYFHFGNKAALLKQVLDVAAVGDDEPVPLLDRPWMEDIRNEPDPRKALELWITAGRSIYERVAPLFSVVRQAAAVDADMAAQWITNERQRLMAHHHVAELLAAKRGLRPGLSIDKATDIIVALISPELFLLLTGDRRWTAEEWERFIASILAHAVLTPRSHHGGNEDDARVAPAPSPKV